MKNVVFVCIGNSCRSQMAEGFARRYGSDVMQAFSAGLAPASIVQPLTIQVMEEKNISLEGQFPKVFTTGTWDLVVNLSGFRLNAAGCPVRDWLVEDPIGRDETFYRQVRDQIEGLVMRLILELRAEARQRPSPAEGEQAAGDRRKRPRLRG